MKITNQEVMQKIKQHKFIIITGTTDGRKRIRKLIDENLGKKRIIDTRRYAKNQYALEKQSDFNDIWQLDGRIKEDEQYQYLEHYVNVLQRKKRPVIIDSFTDIQRIVVQHSKDSSDGPHEIWYNWALIKQQLKTIITNLLKYKKQLILFCDLKEDSEFKNGKLKHLGYKPNCMKFIVEDSDLVIQATDEDNLLIKDKPTNILEKESLTMKKVKKPRNLYEGQKFGVGSKIEVKGVKKGNKVISKMSDVKVKK